jgi:hypothetical protein
VSLVLRARTGRAALGSALAVVLALSSLFALLGASDLAKGFSALNVEFSGPAYAGISEVVACTLTITGGPAYDLGGNYTYEIEVDAENSTGSKVEPGSGTNPTGVFKLNITMPGEAGQTIDILVNASSKDSSLKNESYEVFTFSIKIVQPIVIQAEVFNTGNADAQNAIAKFYADGALLDTQTFNVSAGDSAVLSYNWTFSSIKDGKHRVSVVVDDTSHIVEFSNGNNEMTQVIYVGEQSNIVGAFLTLAVIFLGAIVFLTYLQKPTRKKKP